MQDVLKISRRFAMFGGAAFVMAGQALAKTIKSGTLTPPEVHKFATTGEVVLIDIRRPDEWAATGSGQGAHRLDLRRKDFTTVLSKIVGGEKSAPIALICARGVRSFRTSARLRRAGFTNIIDVPEGMLGSGAGPGWIRRKLPLIR